MGDKKPANVADAGTALPSRQMFWVVFAVYMAIPVFLRGLPVVAMALASEKIEFHRLTQIS